MNAITQEHLNQASSALEELISGPDAGDILSALEQIGSDIEVKMEVIREEIEQAGTENQ